MDQSHIELNNEAGVATISLNRPQVRNALTPDMMAALATALKECQGDDIRAVVITGRGGAFCSGADVKDLTDTLAKGAQELSRQLKEIADLFHHEIVMGIRQLQKPVIASIGGVAAGGGFSLALACDMRIASQQARFALAYSNIGSTADGGSTYYLPRLLGPALALEVYLMNQPISAQRALEMGLVNRVVPADELEKHTGEMARRLASGPTTAYGRTKALIDRSWDSDLISQMDEEARVFSETALTHDFQEGITAFVEKRGPRFRGS